MSEISPKQRIQNSHRMLQLAQQGMREIADHPNDFERAHNGFANVITHGRSAIESIQKLKRDQLSNFDEWYLPWKKLLLEDQFLVSIWELRNSLAHEGVMPSTSLATSIGRHGPVSIDQLVAGLGEPPPGVIVLNVVLGASPYGRNGWEVQYPDGTTGMIWQHQSIVSDHQQNVISLRSVPGIFRQQRIGEVTFENVALTYLSFVNEFIDAAEKEFVK